MKYKKFPIADTAVRFMLRVPYLMNLYYSMTIYEDPSIPTLCVNGVSVWVNPAFWNQLTRDQKLTAIAHEVFHKMLMHPTRRGARDMFVWNIAGDFIINDMLVQMNFTPLQNLTIDGKPWSWCYDPKLVAKGGGTTEGVYDEIIREAEQNGQGQEGQGEGEGGEDGDEGEGDGEDSNDGGNQSGGTSPGDARRGKKNDPFQRASEQAKRRLGGFQDIRDFGETPDGDVDEGEDGKGVGESPADHEQRVRKEIKDAEMQAKMQGTSPAWMERVIGNAFHAQVKWHEVLEQYLKSLHQSDYSWSRINRRELIKTGCIAPDMWQPSMGPIAIFIDTSGSIGDNELGLFLKHLRDVLEQVRPKGIDIFYWDTDLKKHEHFDRCEYEIDTMMLKPVGGGGSVFRGMPRAIDNHCDELPDCALIFTDMYVDFPREMPVPTVWLSSSHIETAPFGSVLKIN